MTALPREKRDMQFTLSTDPLRPPLHDAALVSLEALKGLTAFERMEIVCRQIVGTLQAIAKEVGHSPLERASYDALCTTVSDWLGEEIDNLRFLHG